jgi:hypothetical protein
MKKLSILTSICLLLAVFILSGCEGNTNKERVIQNNAVRSIHVAAQFTNAPNFNATILPGQSAVLFTEHQLGSNSQADNPALGISSMVITNEKGDTCQKDYGFQSSWQITIEHKKRVPSSYQHTYLLSVSDNDF